MRGLLLAAVVLEMLCVVDAPLRAQSPASDARVRTAIVAAVRSRMGARAEVRIESLDSRGTFTGPLIAVPAPGAVTGSHIRFVLTAAENPSVRVGEADALLFVSMPHARATQPLPRGEPIQIDYVTEEMRDVGSMYLQQLPSRDLVAGAVPIRDVVPGEVLTVSLVAIPALVKSGDKILVSAAINGVEVQATLVATQGGVLGDVIRCVNPETRRTMTARIVGRGAAEVVDAF